MLTAMTPFNHAMKSDQYYCQLIKNPIFYWKAMAKYQDNKDFFSQEFIDLTTKMLAFDPAERLSLEGVIKHPWFKGKIAT